jgi:hypothetical protein
MLNYETATGIVGQGKVTVGKTLESSKISPARVDNYYPIGRHLERVKQHGLQADMGNAAFGKRGIFVGQGDKVGKVHRQPHLLLAYVLGEQVEQVGTFVDLL